MSTFFGGSGPGRTGASQPRYALVFKTYGWDAFIERQARRWAARTRTGDFFISADETNGSLGTLPFENVIRTTNAELVAFGFADRFERGSLLWWNADYVHYHFFNRHPDYDYYLFVEYDSLYGGDCDSLVDGLAIAGTDFAALPLKESKETWAWTRPHLYTYPLEDVEGCLMCISAFSRRAMRLLAKRRCEMRQDSGVVFWPSAEVFLPTEIKRAALTFTSLESFGDITHLNWRPPHLEQDVLDQTQPAFLHPVYDQSRYVRWLVDQGATLRASIDPKGPVLKALSRFPLGTYLPALTQRIFANLVATLRYRSGREYWHPSSVAQSRQESRQP